MTVRRSSSMFRIPLRYRAHYLVFPCSLPWRKNGFSTLSPRLLGLIRTPLRYLAHSALGRMALAPATSSGANRYVIERKLYGDALRLYWLHKPLYALKRGYVIERITSPATRMILVNRTNPM
jgi:hypothetical protein